MEGWLSKNCKDKIHIDDVAKSPEKQAVLRKVIERHPYYKMVGKTIVYLHVDEYNALKQYFKFAKIDKVETMCYGFFPNFGLRNLIRTHIECYQTHRMMYYRLSSLMALRKIKHYLSTKKASVSI